MKIHYKTTHIHTKYDAHSAQWMQLNSFQKAIFVNLSLSLSLAHSQIYPSSLPAHSHIQKKRIIFNMSNKWEIWKLKIPHHFLSFFAIWKWNWLFWLMLLLAYRFSRNTYFVRVSEWVRKFIWMRDNQGFKVLH